jgi:hypothetical protein
VIAILAGVVGFVAAAFGAVFFRMPGLLVLWVPCMLLIGLGFAIEAHWAERQARREAME